MSPGASKDDMVSFGMFQRKTPTQRSLGSSLEDSSLGTRMTSSGRAEKPINGARIRRRPRPKIDLSVPLVFGLCLITAMLAAAFRFLHNSPTLQNQAMVRSPSRVGVEVVYPRITYLDKSAKHSTTKILQGLSSADAYFSTNNTHSVKPMISREFWEVLKDSDEYERHQDDTFESETCKAMYPWQLMAFPACNSFHEINMPRLSVPSSDSSVAQLEYLTSGYWRDVWLLQNTSLDSTVVLKTTCFVHNVTMRNYDRNRRDSLVMERLTKSPWIMNIYGFCGISGLSEYAGGGDVSSAIWTKSESGNDDNLVPSSLTHQELMHIGVQAAIGLAELHNFDKEGRPSVAHTDITPGQFVKVDSGRYKLQDFNRARFIRWDAKKQKPCTYNVSSNPGRNRSPEEYAYKPQTEKVDLYSLGNLFFMLLQKQWPFHADKTKKAQELVRKGYRPSFYEDVWYSNNSYDKALKEAMLMCHEQEPEKRKPAREVANYLKKQLEALDPGVLASWGEPLAPP